MVMGYPILVFQSVQYMSINCINCRISSMPTWPPVSDLLGMSVALVMTRIPMMRTQQQRKSLRFSRGGWIKLQVKLQQHQHHQSALVRSVAENLAFESHQSTNILIYFDNLHFGDSKSQFTLPFNSIICPMIFLGPVLPHSLIWQGAQMLERMEDLKAQIAKKKAELKAEKLFLVRLGPAMLSTRVYI